MIKLYLGVSDVIHANEQTKYANCDLHVNFWNFLLMSFCLVTKKNHFNPSPLDPGQREKINLNFYFHTSLCSFKAFIKPFEAPQRSMKIKI